MLDKNVWMNEPVNKWKRISGQARAVCPGLFSKGFPRHGLWVFRVLTLMIYQGLGFLSGLVMSTVQSLAWEWPRKMKMHVEPLTSLPATLSPRSHQCLGKLDRSTYESTWSREIYLNAWRAGISQKCSWSAEVECGWRKGKLFSEKFNLPSSTNKRLFSDLIFIGNTSCLILVDWCMAEDFRTGMAKKTHRK